METIKDFISRTVKKIDRFFDNLYDIVMTFFRKHYLWLVFIVIFAVSLSVRILFFEYLSGDMYYYLLTWFNHLKVNGGFRALGSYPWTDMGLLKAGDYPVSYINVLALLSYLPMGDIYAIKSFNVFFDYVIAFGGLLIVREFNKDKFFSLITFTILVFFPTSILNSSLWGQSDQVYVGFLVWTLYFLIKEKQGIAMVFLGLAFSFKIQTSFFLPMLVFMWLNKKFKLRYLLVAAFVCFLTFLPSYIAGAPFTMPFNMYRQQVTTMYKDANYGSGSIYAFFEFSRIYDGINAGVGVLIAFLAIGITLLYLYHYKVPATKKNIIFVAALFSLVSPFFLPHMHERYFYMADVFLILYVLVYKRKYAFAALMSVSSVLAYTHFLMGGYIFKFLGQDSVRLAAMINLGLIIGLILEAPKVLEKEPVILTLVKED